MFQFFNLFAEGALHDGRAQVRFPFAHHKHSADSSTFGKLDLHLFQMFSAFVIKNVLYTMLFSTDGFRTFHLKLIFNRSNWHYEIIL
jgi:hypothetical protein